MVTSTDNMDNQLTLEDFRQCEWEHILEENTFYHYRSLWLSFKRASIEADNNGNLKQAHILHLFSLVYSLKFIPKNRSNPFTNLEYFSNEEINFFSTIIDDVKNYWLKAQLADIVWNKKREKKYALTAIDAYQSTPIVNTNTSFTECWERAITLSRMIQRMDSEIITRIEYNLCSIVLNQPFDNVEIAIQGAKILYDERLGNKETNRFGERFKELGQEFDKRKEYLTAQSCFEISAQWFHISKNKQSEAFSTFLWAKSLEKEAQHKIDGEVSSHTVAGIIFGEAINVYRKIPKAERKNLGVKDRIEQLKSKMSETNIESQSEMAIIKTPGFDISQCIQEAEQKVTEKSLDNALFAWATISHFQGVENLYKTTLEQIKQHPISALIPQIVKGSEGRIVGRIPGLNITKDEESNRDSVYEMMRRNYFIGIGLKVCGQILPALSVINLEHRIREEDIFSIVKQSLIVPINRIHIFTKSLYAGFNFDFLSCIHLLAPQIEHMVRCHLKNNEISTTTLDSKKKETENGLSTLMENPKTEEIFSKDLCFEIKALFCTPFGPNIRNYLAHGLLEEDFFNTSYPIYAWWLSFAFIYKNYWQRTHTQENSIK